MRFELTRETPMDKQSIALNTRPPSHDISATFIYITFKKCLCRQ